MNKNSLQARARRYIRARPLLNEDVEVSAFVAGYQAARRDVRKLLVGTPPDAAENVGNWLRPLR